MSIDSPVSQLRCFITLKRSLKGSIVSINSVVSICNFLVLCYAILFWTISEQYIKSRTNMSQRRIASLITGRDRFKGLPRFLAPPAALPSLSGHVTTAEKGAGWRRKTLRGTCCVTGHGYLAARCLPSLLPPVFDPGYMSRKIWKFWTDKFDTRNKRKFWLMQLT